MEVCTDTYAFLKLDCLLHWIMFSDQLNSKVKQTRDDAIKGQVVVVSSLKRIRIFIQHHLPLVSIFYDQLAHSGSELVKSATK